ncbi:MAG TPA: signal peptidase II [Candidatus Acidoferrum sp.]|nr:signal peptidase II [Candidatus Acidoferrum sp.]
MIIPGRIRWLWLTLAVVLLDRATKAWIESRPLTYFPHVVIPNWFSIILSKNPGIAFSFFSNGSSMLTRVILIAGSALIIGLIAWLLVAGREASAVNAAGLALLLGGAAGNLTDRIVHGAVTDFLEVWVRFLPFSLFNPWPTFNIADAGVTVGALLLLFDVIFSSPKKPAL